MNRRTLLKRFSAIVAAVTVAPAVKPVEAALSDGVHRTFRTRSPVLDVNSNSDLTGDLIVSGEPFGMLAWTRPEGAPEYHSVTLKEIESPAFEQMVADCAARGCWVSVGSDDHWLHATFSKPEPPREVVDLQSLIESDLARIDAWRRGLHEQT